MKMPKFRGKRVIITTVAAVAVLGVGGAVWATTASADVQGGERDRVANAATKAVPGTVQDVETSDDPGEAYEVEVRKDDGTEVDVTLDKDLNVVGQDTDAGDDTPDADERVLSATERTSAEQAALGAVAGGTVIQVEAGDGDAAYEVEVRDAADAEWDVDLDAGFKVLRKTADD
jgi:uncharacterized membrane protein YkoI